MRRTLQRTPSQAAAVPVAADIEDTAQEVAVAFATAAPPTVEAPAPRILKNAASRAAAAAAAAGSTSVVASSPVPSTSPDPNSNWDLSALIAQYASSSPSPEADDAEGGEYAEGDADEEEGEEEHIEPEEEQEDTSNGDRPDAITTAPRRIVSLVGTAAAASSLRPRDDRLAPNTRFLGNLLRGTVSHNERVEHVVLAMRGCDNGGVEAEAAEITVYDPRGTYNGLSLSKSAAAAANAAAPKLRAAAASGRNLVLSHDPSAVAASGSLEAEARKLMAAFEGSSVGGGGGVGGRAAPVRKVRGRGRALAGMKDSTSNIAVRDDVDMTEMASQQRNNAASSTGKGTVAASHLHTPEQRAAYQQTHDKYKRARGVTLLHHIAKAYGISILIQPAGTAAESSDEEIDAAAALLEKQAAKAKAAKALAAVVTPAPAPTTAAASRPARLFTTSLSNIGQLARSFSNPPADTFPAAAGSLSSDGNARVRITLQRTIAAESSPSPPAASPSPPAVGVSSVRRTFDAPLVSSPSPATESMSVPAPSSTASAATASAGRKIVTLSARSSSNGATLPAAAALAAASTSAASSQPQNRVLSAVARPTLQLHRKRKESEQDSVEPNTDASSADSPAPSLSPPAESTLAASSSPAMIRSSSLGATPAAASGLNARGASIPLAKRKRTGGILGAALSGILGGSSAR